MPGIPTYKWYIYILYIYIELCLHIFIIVDIADSVYIANNEVYTLVHIVC